MVRNKPLVSKPETMLLFIMIMYDGWFRTGTKLQSLLDVWAYIYIYIYIYVYMHFIGTCMCWVRVMEVWRLVAWACLSSGGRAGQQGSCSSLARLLHAVQWTQNLPQKWMKIWWLATAKLWAIASSFCNINHRIWVNVWGTVMLGLHHTMARMIN